MDNLFILKKIVSFFVEPLGFTLLLLFMGIFALYRGRVSKAKLYLSFTILFILLFSYPPFSNILVNNLEYVYPKFDEKDANISYIHVLGNANNDDMTQPISSMLSEASMKRVVEGVLIHKKYPNTKLIFTGYAGETDLANAQANAALARALGVDEKDMIINPAPKDTKEEVLFAKSIVGEKPFVVVSSASHLLRAIKLYKDQGLDPFPAPTDYKKRNIESYLMKPDMESFKNSQVAIHEYIGLLWAAFVH